MRAYQLNPSAADVNVGLAVAQWGAGLKEEALATFERGLQFPKDPELLKRICSCLAKGGGAGGPHGRGSIDFAVEDGDLGR